MPFWTVLAVVLSIVTTGVSYVQAKKAQKAAKKNQAKNQELLINKQSNVEPIPVIYGERRVGGTRVFVHTGAKYIAASSGWEKWDYGTSSWITDTSSTSAPNEYLYVALVLCEGEVESITNIEIDDLPITDSKYTGLITAQTFTGADNQAASSLLQQATQDWTSDHKLSGIAYIALQFKYAPEIWSGVPEITALVKGKKVYDPRTSTTAWSNNPALCIRDYLTNTRYGKGIPTSAIDDTTFSNAATDCEQSVVQHDNTSDTMSIFECNVVLDTSKTLFDNLNILAMGCRGYIPYVQGEYQLVIDKTRTSQFTFTKDHIIGGIAIRGEAKEDKFNQVIVKFANPDRNWQDDIAIWPPAGSQEETDYLAEDGGILLKDEIELDTITNYYQARDLARVFLLRSRNQLKTQITTTSEGLAYSVGDVISITHTTPGWSAKPFIIEEMTINEDLTVDFQCVEYDGTIYTYDVNAEQDAYPDTYLPDPSAIREPTNLSVTEDSDVNDDGTVRYRAVITWDAPDDLFVTAYHVQAKLSTASQYVERTTSELYYIVNNLKPGTYNLRIRSVNTNIGAYSDWVTTTIAIGGKTTANAAPTNVTATGKLKQILVDWDDPADADHKESQVFRNTSNDSGTSAKIATTSASYYIDTDVTPGSTYYYWIKSVDRSGNASVFSLGVSASADAESSGFPSNAIGYVYYQSSTASNPGTPSAASYAFSNGAFTGLTAGWGANPPTISGSSQIWYSRYTVAESSAGSGSGTPAFEATQQGYGFVGLVTFSSSTTLTDGTNSFNSATKVSVGGAAYDVNTNVTTINGGQITSGTITANQIAANTITSAEIQSGSITVDRIQSGTSSTSSGRTFGLGAGATVNGFNAAGVFTSSTSSAAGLIVGTTQSVGAALAAANSLNTAGNVAIIGYGDTTTSYTGAVTNGILGEPTYGVRGYHNTSNKYAQLGTSSYSVYANSDIYCAGSYLPFTGVHDALLDDQESVEIGDILVDVSIEAKSDISNVISLATKSSSTAQPTAIGIFSGYAPDDHIPITLQSVIPANHDDKVPTPIITVKEAYINLLQDNDLVYVNAVGEGQINVCGENGNIQPGDLIVTSSVPGKGMKQNDDIIRSCTVAKAREAAEFSGNETAQIACIYLCG